MSHDPDIQQLDDKVYMQNMTTLINQYQQILESMHLGKILEPGWKKDHIRALNRLYTHIVKGKKVNPYYEINRVVIREEFISAFKTLSEIADKYMPGFRLPWNLCFGEVPGQS